jgi:hypothetical protein
MGNLALYYDPISTEGSLALNCDDCHAYLMRGGIVSIALNPVKEIILIPRDSQSLNGCAGTQTLRSTSDFLVRIRSRLRSNE